MYAIRSYYEVDVIWIENTGTNVGGTGLTAVGIIASAALIVGIDFVVGLTSAIGD